MYTNTETSREIRWSIVVSVLMIVAGFLAIVVPPASGIAVTLLVGWLLIFSGAAHLAYASRRHHRGGLWWGLLLGILYIATGGCILAQPVIGLESLTLVLAAYLFVESVLEFVLAFFLRPLKGSGWLLLDGIITLILAIMILRTWPSSALWVIGTLVGISIAFSGVARLMLSLAVRRGANDLQQNAPAH